MRRRDRLRATDTKDAQQYQWGYDVQDSRDCGLFVDKLALRSSLCTGATAAGF